MGLIDMPYIQGTLSIYERPDWISLEDFMQPGAGHHVLTAENLVLNQVYSDLFSLWNTGTTSTTGLMKVQTLALGTGSLGAPGANDVSLTTLWKTYPVVVAASSTIGSPPSPKIVFTFFSPAADTPPGQITEAGLNATSLAGSTVLITHLNFLYTKPTSTDIRIDYNLTRGGVVGV